MKLAVVSNINGTFKIESEWDVGDEYANAQGAIVNFHSKCQTLWNAPDVLKGTVKILDDNLNLFEDYEETITHNPQPEPEPEPEPEGE